MSKRHPRFGTPLPPGRRRYLLPEMRLPRTRHELNLTLRRRRVQARLGLGLAGAVVIGLAFSLLTAPPSPPNIGVVNSGQSRFGPVRFNAPVGWAVQIGSDDLDTPWVMFAPQNDPAVAPTTISIVSVDVTDRLRVLDAALSSPEPSASPVPINARILLETLARQSLALVARGPFCTLAQSYGSDIGVTGALLPALLVEWQKPIPWGSKLIEGAASPLGQSKNIGTCPPFIVGSTPSPSPGRSGSATPSPSVAPSPSATSSPSSAFAPVFILAAVEITPIPSVALSPTSTPGPTLDPSGSPILSATPGSPSGSATPSLAAGSNGTPRPSGSNTVSSGPLMHQVEWFALPPWPGLRTNDTQRMLVITLTYPDSLSADQRNQARYVFAQLITTINSD